MKTINTSNLVSEVKRALAVSSELSLQDHSFEPLTVRQELYLHRAITAAAFTSAIKDHSNYVGDTNELLNVIHGLFDESIPDCLAREQLKQYHNKLISGILGEDAGDHFL